MIGGIRGGIRTDLVVRFLKHGRDAGAPGSLRELLPRLHRPVTT